jgi:hypothetical protein
MQELKKNQAAKMVQLCKEQYQSELDLHLKYHPLLYDTLETIISTSYTNQLSRLDEVHDKEVGELKKKLDIQNREEMKVLAKKHKDKNELARFEILINYHLTVHCTLGFTVYTQYSFIILVNSLTCSMTV